MHGLQRVHVWVQSPIPLELVACVQASSKRGDWLEVETIIRVAGEPCNVVFCVQLVGLDAPVPRFHVARDTGVGRSKRVGGQGVHGHVVAHAHVPKGHRHTAAVPSRRQCTGCTLYV